MSDLFNKVMSKGTDMMNKGKEVGTILQIKSQIALEENKLNEVYKDIGKEICNRYSNPFDKLDSIEEIAAIWEAKCIEVNEIKERILNFENKINELEGYIKCPVCGSKVEKGKKFCGCCGKNIE